MVGITDIERTRAAVIDAITVDRMSVDSKIVKAAWRDYVQYWPDCGRAILQLEEYLLESMKDDPDAVIKLGQYMENLSWSLRKEL